MEEKKTIRPENFIAGLVGAFFGSLLGVALIVLLGQLGYVAAVSGLVMAVCALKGYEKLGGALSKKGVIASSVIILVMTYIGNRLDWAVEASRVLEIGFMDAYRAIPLFLEEGVIESATYWGNLALLYLFTLVGAVPTIHAALQGPKDMGDFDRTLAEGQPSEDASSLVVYSIEPKWIRPYMWILALTVLTAILWVPMVIAGAGAISTDDRMSVMVAVWGVVYLAVLFWAIIRNNNDLMARNRVYARYGGVLWRVDTTALDCQMGYRVGKNQGMATFWHKLSPEKQQICKQEILYAIRSKQQQEPGQKDPYAKSVIPLRDLQVVKSGKRAWTVQYEDAAGRAKTLKIPKLYPELILEPGAEPLEKGPGASPLPVVVLLLVCLLPLGAIALPQLGIGAGTTAYDLGPIHFEMEDRMEEDEPGIFVDPKSETVYVVDETLYGMAPEQVHTMLDLRLEELKTNFDERTSELLSQEGELVDVEGPDGTYYQYDRYLFANLDGTVVLGYGVYIPQKGCVVKIEAVMDNETSDDVDARVLDMIRTLRVDADAEVMEVKDLELTEENYQSFFAPAEEFGYTHVGRAFLKAPQGMFDGGGFTDVYLPYSDSPMYSEDGTVISSVAHGVQMDVTLLHHTGTAEDVVKELAQAVFDAKGWELNGEPFYDEDLNVALWFGIQEDTLAPWIFYADIKKPDYYLTAIFTYLPQEEDEDSQLLLQELSDAYALELPPLDITSDDSDAA